MAWRSVASLDDPALAPFRDLKRTNATRWTDAFVAEGRWVVERLMDSRFPVRSVLVTESRRSAVPPDWARRTDVLVVPDALADRLVGFQFHQGLLACGERRAGEEFSDVARLDDPARLRRIWGEPTVATNDVQRPARDVWIVCPHTTDPDNLGQIIRSARAFGCCGVLLGRRCCDPFSRRVIRVSMGNVFFVPTLQFDDLGSVVDGLRQRGWESWATVLSEDAVPLPRARFGKRVLLLLGNEAWGLGDTWLARADHRTTIPMFDGTDSLNVAHAASVALYAVRFAPHG